MPDVKNLTGNTPKPATPVKPAPKPASPPPAPKPASPPPAPRPTPPAPKPVPASTSLTQSNGENALATRMQEMNIPGWLQTSTMPNVMGADQTGFVGFGSSRSLKWVEQQASGVEDGMPYLWHNQNYLPLESLDFFLLAGESFQSLMVGQKGDFLFVTRDLELQGPTHGSNKTEAHYVCLLIVDVGNGQLIPIKGDFRGTKSRGIEGSIRAIEAAATPEWLGLSDAHQITAMFPQPFGRVYHRITTERGVSQTNGNPYFVTNAVCAPASIAQMQMLVDAFADEAFQASLAEAKQNFNLRIAFMEKVIANPKVS